MTASTNAEINRGSYELAAGSYERRGDALTPPERVVFDAIAPEVRGERILDLGVGAGRTTAALRAISEHYIGIDYAGEMVASCRRRFPGVDFRHMDATDLSAVESASVGLVVFSYNGIDCVGHEDRLRALAEALRVLRPGGIFVFSAHNREGADARAARRRHPLLFSLPSRDPGGSPLERLRGALRFARTAALRARNRFRLRGREEQHDEYAILNDASRDYACLTYYIAIETQLAQLARAGFSPEVRLLDQAGCPIEGPSNADWVYYVARKPSEGAGGRTTTA